MLNFIARDLRYFGLNRVVDVRNGEVTWSSILELEGRLIFHAAGESPDSALENVIIKALLGQRLPTLDTALGLDQLAANLLQLVIRFAPTPGTGAKPWHGIVRVQQPRTFLFFKSSHIATHQVTGLSPDEVLNEVILLAVDK